MRGYDDPYAAEHFAALEARDAQDHGPDDDGRPSRQELAAEEARDAGRARAAAEDLPRLYDPVNRCWLTSAGRDVWRVEDGSPF